jgi:hypothetical protein
MNKCTVHAHTVHTHMHNTCIFPSKEIVNEEDVTFTDMHILTWKHTFQQSAQRMTYLSNVLHASTVGTQFSHKIKSIYITRILHVEK